MAPEPRFCAVDGRSPASPLSVAANALGASPSEMATATAVTAIRVRRGVTGFLSRGTEGVLGQSASRAPSVTAYPSVWTLPEGLEDGRFGVRPENLLQRLHDFALR